MEGEEGNNWSEKVEDLVDAGDTDAAISLLETLIFKLETLSSPGSQPQLASALLDLSKLYSSKGFSLKSDDARSRASALNLRSQPSLDAFSSQESRVSKASINNLSSTNNESRNGGDSERRVSSSNDNIAPQESSEDDWEAIADRAADELLSPKSLPEVSKLSIKDSEKQMKRRGRGNFSYKKHGLYSDQQSNESFAYDSPPDEVAHEKPEKFSEARSLYGTRHVLVLDGFHPSTKASDLEKLFVDFRDHGFSIRWINDTVALAVFRTPPIALEARNSLKCSFSVRVLEEDDPILSSISVRDLDPPRQRPKTSARTAQRLIAQELGVKMPLTFGSRELRKQEDSRKSRIINRQNLRDEAWGRDDTQ